VRPSRSFQKGVINVKFDICREEIQTRSKVMAVGKDLGRKERTATKKSVLGRERKKKRKRGE